MPRRLNIVPYELRARPPGSGAGGAVHDGVAIAHQRSQIIAGQIGKSPSYAATQLVGLACGGDHIVAAARQIPGYVRADESVRACDEHTHINT